MNYKETIDFLEKQNKSNGVPYLKNAIALLNLKINPNNVILVAGTNGKGTTCATLQTLLHAAGKNVGFYSSPHLEKTNERIKFNCADISDKDFCDVFSKVYDKLHHLEMSHFEWLTLMSAYYFFEVHKNEIDYAIFEVGLGGSLDATNAIPHAISVIAKLGIDHEKILGNSSEEIAENKFGIISHNNRVFHTKFSDEILKLSYKYEKKFNVRFIEACDYSLEVDVSEKYPVFIVKTSFGKFKMSIPGARAAENTALAITIFNELVNDGAKHLSAIEKVYWPCRMEKIAYKNRDIFLSGDHNPQGIDSLLDILRYYNYERIHIIVGICNDKNHHSMLSRLFSLSGSDIYITETTAKPLPLNDYEDHFKKRAKFLSSNFSEALNEAISNAKPDDIVVVTGSLYLVGSIRKYAKNTAISLEDRV